MYLKVTSKQIKEEWLSNCWQLPNKTEKIVKAKKLHLMIVLNFLYFVTSCIVLANYLRDYFDRLYLNITV